MTRLWDKGAALDDRVLAYTAGEDHLLDNRLVRYDILASIAHAEMLGEQGLLSAGDLAAITRRCARSARSTSAGNGASRSSRKIAKPRSRIYSLRASAPPADACTPDARATIRCSPPLRLYLREATQSLHDGALASRRRSTRWRRATARSCFPATPTCSRPCRAPWRCGRSASPPRSATTRRACNSRSGARPRIRSDPRPATAHRISTSAASRRGGVWASPSRTSR